MGNMIFWLLDVKEVSKANFSRILRPFLVFRNHRY